MAVLGWVSLVLALGIGSAAAGADHDVQQVQGPHVVKYEVGPLMEVSRNNKREAGGCLSCSVHGVGSSNYDRGYSTATYGTGGQSYPQTTSSRQEFRSEQQYVNGKPVYRLQHERSFQDGHLVHDRRLEEDEDDLGYSASAGTGYSGQSSLTRSGSTSISGHGQGSHYPLSGSHTSDIHGSSSQERFSGSLQNRFRQMQEDLRRQMLSQTPHQPAHGGSHRSEHHSETRYINGQQVYKKEKELSYQDGQLVMNRTEEEGPDDLGTEDVVRRYDSSGALVTDSSSRGYYGSSQGHDGHYSSSPRAPYPGYTYTATYPSYSSWQSWSSWSSSGYPASPSYPSSSGQVSNRRREETNWSSSRYPSYRPESSSNTYREEEDRYSSSYPSYMPTSSSSSTTYRQDQSQYSSSYPSPGPARGSSPREEDDEDDGHSTSHPSYGPTSRRVSTTYREEDRRHSSSYPSSIPSSGSYSTTYREEEDRHSSSYRPESGGSSTTLRPVSGNSYTTHRPELGSPSITHRPASGSSSTTYRRQESQHSFSYPYHGSSPSTSTPSSLDVLPVHQGVSPSSAGTRTYHHTSGHSVRGESEEEHIHGPIGGHREPYYGGYEQRRSEERRSSSPRPAVVDTSRGGARTVAFDLSSSSSTPESSITGHLLQPSNSGRRHDTWDEDLQQREDDDYEPHEERVGIPGVISGPPSSSVEDVDHREDDDGDDSHRYDISPHVDGFVPTLPTVDNEVESAPIPVPNPGGEDNGSTEVHGDDDDESSDDRRTSDRRLFSSGSISTTYNYRNSHTREDDQGTGHSFPGHSDRHRSQTFSHDESHPVVGSSRYHYNETSTRTSTTRGHQQHGAIPGHPHSTPCSQPGGCVIPGMPDQFISRRTETRTMRRYVNGQLVGVTIYERQFENGELVHENRTDYDRDEAIRLGLGDIDTTQMDLRQGTYHPESYSQQHEVRTEKKFVNGQQVHEVNHERRYEDGALVFDNLVEKDEDDFEDERHNMGGGDTRQQVTQTQHHHRQDTSGRRVAGVSTQDSRDRPVAVVPHYSSRRYESREEQEFIDGHPVYGLHHERHYKDGSLVHENRTELTEEDLGEGGYHDALHNILAGKTLLTPTQAPHTGSHYGASVERTSQSRESHTRSGSTSYDQSRHTYGQAGGASDEGRGFYGQGAGDSYRERETASGSFSSSLLNSRGHGSGRATTTVLGGSGSLLTGLDSQRRSSFGDEEDSLETTSSHESHGTTFQGQGFRGSESTYHDTDSLRSEERVSQGSASTYGSHSTASQARGSESSGCLSCVLLSGVGHTRDSSSGMAGAGGYSHREEMSAEEHYEDGRLVHGRQESRKFRDGKLVHEDKRQYPLTSETQVSRGAGLGGQDSSHYASSSSSSTSSSSSWHSSSGSGRVGSEVCTPNPCHNGGTCLQGVYSAICTCRFGFSGRTCEELECPRGYCRRGGTCSVEDGRHVCTCRSGYEGPRCQRRSPSRKRRHATRP